MAVELSRAAVVTLLSDFETHPLVVLEAAALGRPVLVADTSGLSELAEQGFARAIPLHSSPSLTAAAIIEEMSRSEVTPRPTIPTWDDCAGQLLAVYRDVLGAPA